MQQLLAAQFQQKKVYVVADDENGQFLYGGDAYIATTTATAPNDDALSFDYELTGTGKLTTVPVS